jgi:secreted PhoX family phosphatase
MPRQELSVLLHQHDADNFATTSCNQCRFACGSLVSRTEKGAGDTFGAVLSRRISRRGLLKASVVLSAALTLGPGAAAATVRAAHASPATAPAEQGTGLSFTAIMPDTTDVLTVAEGYTAQVLLSWGDPIIAGAPAFEVNAQSAAAQAAQFGFNSDFVLFTPLPYGSNSMTEGLLWNNHEYTDGLMMFPGYDAKNPTVEQVDIELAAHGASLVMVRRTGANGWEFDPTSTYNRRITATTPMTVSGPAAGDDWLKTSADPTGKSIVGMLNNCGGGWTPWGTILTAEENFNQYFANADMLPAEDPRKKVHARYGLPVAASERLWETFYDRFDITKEPNEPFRHGWVVEVDPYDPTFQPVKRTALGRLKHEAATSVVAVSGKLVVYTGDDERFDYIYKYVSDGHVNMSDRAANRNLLDQGTLYAAKLNDDGTGAWLPLVFGQGPLTAANGWRNQADVLIRARQAGDALEATKMDRPEDVEVNPVNGKVYAAMTNNTLRGTDGRPTTDTANPRATNAMGHIIEIAEDDGNHSQLTFTWEVFLLAGKPEDPSTYFAGFPKDQVSAFGCPDNISFDSRGNLWIATDGQPSALKVNDAILAVAVEGPERGQVKQFLSAVAGSEVASLYMIPDDSAMFLSVQHPGEGGTLAQPTSTFPNGFARPSVVVVSRVGGGKIGG